MNDNQTREKREACQGVATTDRAEGLASITDAGVAAVLWRRQRPTGFDDWLGGLPPEQLPSGRITLRPDAVRAAVTHHCDATGMPDTDERRWLVDDIAALAEHVADIMRVPRVRLRLDVIRSVMCPKFHVDTVTARLLCTYRGPGTQYGIARQGDAPDDVFDTPTGMPLLLRGKHGQADRPTALLHRSPPIDQPGETRLLLVLDPAA